MNDKDIRSALVRHIQLTDAEAVILEELPLRRGIGRADVAAINGAMWGYEIKGSGDSLRRLGKQVDDYGHVFDYCLAVVAPNHLDAARRSLPSHWGIMAAVESEKGDVLIQQVRKPRRNTATDLQSLIRLIWRREALKALRNHGITLDQRTLISTLWDTMVAELSPRVISKEVRSALKARGGS